MFFIRHSIRLDHANKEEWIKHKRFKTNKNDPPITDFGKIYAFQKLSEILKNTPNDFTYIYSSPMTRCIETSIQFQNYIKDIYDKHILIRIEYGLTPYKILNNKILDDELQKEYIFKKYNIINFDTNYNSIFNFNDINNEKKLLNSINLRLCTIKNLIKKINKKKITLICTHSENLFLLKNFLDVKTLQKKIMKIEKNKNYCASVRLFEK
jgi:hypothetical protein